MQSEIQPNPASIETEHMWSCHDLEEQISRCQVSYFWKSENDCKWIFISNGRFLISMIFGEAKTLKLVEKLVELACWCHSGFSRWFLGQIGKLEFHSPIQQRSESRIREALARDALLRGHWRMETLCWLWRVREHVPAICWHHLELKELNSDFNFNIWSTD